MMARNDRETNVQRLQKTVRYEVCVYRA